MFETVGLGDQVPAPTSSFDVDRYAGNHIFVDVLMCTLSHG